MTPRAIGQVLAVLAVLIVTAAGLTLPAYLSPANAAWAGAFGLAWVAGVLAIHENGRQTRTIAQVLNDTESSGRSATGRRDL